MYPTICNIWMNEKGSFSLETAIIMPIVCSFLLITLIIFVRFTDDAAHWIQTSKDTDKLIVPVKLIRTIDLAQTNIEAFIHSKNQTR